MVFEERFKKMEQSEGHRSIFSDIFKIVNSKQEYSTSFSFALEFLTPSQASPPAVCLQCFLTSGMN